MSDHFHYIATVYLVILLALGWERWIGWERRARFVRFTNVRICGISGSSPLYRMALLSDLNIISAGSYYGHIVGRCPHLTILHNGT